MSLSGGVVIFSGGAPPRFFSEAMGPVPFSSARLGEATLLDVSLRALSPSASPLVVISEPHGAVTLAADALRVRVSAGCSEVASARLAIAAVPRSLEGPVVVARLGAVPAAVPATGEYALFGASGWSGVARFSSATALFEAAASASSASEGEFFSMLLSRCSRVEGFRVSDACEPDVFARMRMSGIRARPASTIELSADGSWVRKSSSVDPGKLTAELEWLLSAAAADADLVPAIGASGVSADGGFFYDTAFVGPFTLADMMLRGVHPDKVWEESCAGISDVADRLRLLGQAGAARKKPNVMQDLLLSKTLARIAMIPREERAFFADPITVDGTAVPSLVQLVDELPALLAASGLIRPRELAGVHGDLFPGNIVMSGRKSLRLIDPRGSFGPAGLLGDPAYDVLKLGHSFLGRYDVMLEGDFSMEPVPGGLEFSWACSSPCEDALEVLGAMVRREWFSRVGLGEPALLLGVAVLLVALAPLHGTPDLRRAFLARGLRFAASARAGLAAL